MKVKGKYNYNYLALNIQASTVKRFRRFAKKTASTQSIALGAMLDFFEWHGHSPFQRFGKDTIAEQQKTRKRINAVIAIIKDIEKSQNIPLINIETMLQALFQGKVKKERPKPLLLETPNSNTVEKGISKMEFERLQRKHLETKERLTHVLEKVEFVRTRFGQGYLKLNIEREELARLKRTLKKV